MPNIRKVVVVGFDGLEPKLVERLIERGELPNMARLRQQGSFARLATTCPAQTPVAWSTFATGVNPGGHGIFDFIQRDPRTYMPQLALNRYQQTNPFLPPKAVNLRRGKTVWDALADHGLPSVVLRCPCTYPAGDVRGRLLSGMGVPDLRGGLGTSTFYTTAEGIKPRESEAVVRVVPDQHGNIATHLLGPLNGKTRKPAEFEIRVEAGPAPDRVIVRSTGEPRELELVEGRWSEWLKVKFKPGLLQSARGMVRFYLVRGKPLELYASPLNFDPQAPIFPISFPAEYAAELESRLGAYYTAGMVEDHAGLSNGRITEEAFLDQCGQVWRQREAMLFDELARLDEGLLFCLFDTPDRVQHMFWRFTEPDHPANQSAGLRAGFERVIDEQYRRCDALAGQVLDQADENTLVIAMSDHGFNSFRRGMHLNTWLHDQGLLALKPNMRPSDEAGDFFHHVDWSRTKAYALGL
ncbi:MAG: alkaline phosphatase family protein, partial [Pirellulales bacterium]